MSESKIECPNPACDELVGPDDHFCPECKAEIGADQRQPEPRELDQTQAPAAASASGETDAREPDTEMPDVAELEAAKNLLHEAEADLPQAEVSEGPVVPQPVQNAGAESEAADSEDDFEDDCPHFRLEFNDARVCVQGWMTSFNFRLVPISTESGQCRLPRLEIRIQGEQPLTKTIFGVLTTGRTKDIDFNFMPQSLGFEISSEIHLTYMLNGVSHSYAGTFKWDAVRAEESSKVIENLVIKMENVEAGMAADQNINILKDFKAKQSSSLTSRLQDLKLRPVWKRVELNDASSGSVETPADLQDRLTLVGPGDMRLHLLGGHRFTMGRGTGGACDITTLLFRGADVPDPKLSCAHGVSRFQAHVIWRNGVWELRDGGIDPSASLSRVKPSSYGTYLNGQKLGSQGQKLERGRSQRITFGLPGMEHKHVFGFDVTVLTDPEKGQAAALLLERVDSVRESFLCLAGRIDLDDLLPGSGDLALRFRKGGFKLTGPHGEKWLKPGTDLNRSWTCQTHAQIGLEHVGAAQTSKRKYVEPPPGWKGFGQV